MDREQLLEAVYERGDALRRRRTRWRAAVAVAVPVVVVAVAVPLAGSQEGGDDVVSLASSTTSTTTTAAPAEEGASTTTDPGPTTSTTVGARDTDAPTTTTTSGPWGDYKCAAVGYPCDWWWDPAPAPNQPLTITIATDPESPMAGFEVEVTVEIRDPDHAVDENCLSIDYGDGSTEPLLCATPMCVEGRSGPYAPPPPEEGSWSGTYTHVYEAPGEFTIKVYKATPECYDPYASNGGAEHTVTVGPLPSS